MADQDHTPLAPSGPSLSPRDAKAVEYYVAEGCCDAQSAMRRAGFAENTVKFKWRKWLERTPIREAIERKQALTCIKSEIVPSVVVAEMAHAAFLDPAVCFAKDEHGRYVLLPIPEMPETARRAIAEMKQTRDKSGNIHTTVKFWPKQGAADLIMRNLGGYRADKVLEVKHSYEEMSPTERAQKRLEFANRRAAIMAKVKEKGAATPQPEATAPSTKALQ